MPSFDSHPKLAPHRARSIARINQFANVSRGYF